MTACDDFIEKIKKELPDPCSAKDLVSFGIFSSENSAWNARRTGTSPEYFKLPHGKIVYPKEAIIDMLKESAHPRGKCFNENNDTGRPYTKSASAGYKKGLRL